MREIEIVQRFKAGASKEELIKSVQFDSRRSGKKITQKEARKIVEKAILDDYIKNMNKAG